MQKFRAVVCDLDGTLVDSLADIATAVNSTLVAHGRASHPLSAFPAMVGWGLRRLLITATSSHPFSSEELETVYGELVGAYAARPVVQTRAYPGASEVVASLDGKTRLGVVTNKNEGIARAIVAGVFPGVGWTVSGARPGRPQKPDPRPLVELLETWGLGPDECAYLGDSDVDMETAVRAGVWACGAAWGYRSVAELRAAGAREIFADWGAFGRWIGPRLVLDKTTADTETEGGVHR